MPVFSKFIAAVIVLFGFTSSAQTTNIVTSDKGSAIYNLALSLAKVATKEGIDLRPRPYKSTSQGTPFVNAGEVDFGLENAFALGQAYHGEGKYQGVALADLRLVARLYLLRTSLYVRKDSGISSMDDLRGKRVAVGFGTAVVGDHLQRAMLAAGGLSLNDVIGVKVSGFRAQREAFLDERIDAVVAITDSGFTAKLAEQVGGLIALDLTNSPDAVINAVREHLPVAALVEQSAGHGVVGIETQTTVLSYDYFLYASTTTPDDVVEKLMRSIYTGKDELVESIASLRSFEPSEMGIHIDMPFHPAAAQFYEAAGVAYK